MAQDKRIENIFDDDEIQRRQWILSSIPYLRNLPMPEGADYFSWYQSTKSHEARELWSNILTDVERNSSPIVYKLLEYATSHDIFGSDPWKEDSYNRLDDLPDKFIHDVKAFIAFTKDNGFCRKFGVYYKVPEQFRDNSDTMKAASSVLPTSLRDASHRVRDDEDTVFAVCGAHDDGWGFMEAIQFASDRLKSNKQFIAKCLVETSKRWKKDKGSSGLDDVYDWLRYGYIFKGHEDDKGWSNVSNGNFTVRDMSDFLNLVPHNQMVDVALHYPKEFFDDEDAILELLKKIEGPTGRASIFGRCSKNVSSSKEVRDLIDPNDVQRIEKDVDSEIADVVNQISTGQIKRFDAIPEAYRIVGDVLSQAVQSGWFDSKDDCMAFITSIKEAKDVWEERHELWWEEYENNSFELYSLLPERLQTDEEICLELLESGYPRYEAMLEKVPSLYRSKQAVEAMLHILDSEIDRQPEETDFIRRSPFRGDKELMVDACNVESDNINLVREELFEDRDFVERVSHPEAIARSSAEFQLNNPDLVEAAIDKLSHSSLDCEYWFEDTPPEVWSVRSVVMAWVTREKGWRHGENRCILKLLYSIDEAHPFLNDKEIVSLSASDGPSDFKYASNELRSDRTFVLQLVRENDRILQYAEEDLWYDDEILIAAICKSEGTIVDCFDILKYQDDKKHLHALSCRIQEKLQLHDVFMRDFLRGIAVSDQHTVPPRLRSPLPMLNQGAETSTRPKKLIAAYADIPICQSYIEMKATAASLNKFGFSS
jgi:hypothetical protein